MILTNATYNLMGAAAVLTRISIATRSSIRTPQSASGARKSGIGRDRPTRSNWRCSRRICTST